MSMSRLRRAAFVRVICIPLLGDGGNSISLSALGMVCVSSSPLLQVLQIYLALLLDIGMRLMKADRDYWHGPPGGT